jgi:hypothetical protein
LSDAEKRVRFSNFQNINLGRSQMFFDTKKMARTEALQADVSPGLQSPQTE